MRLSRDLSMKSETLASILDPRNPISPTVKKWLHHPDFADFGQKKNYDKKLKQRLSEAGFPDLKLSKFPYSNNRENVDRGH